MKKLVVAMLLVGGSSLKAFKEKPVSSGYSNYGTIEERLPSRKNGTNTSSVGQGDTNVPGNSDTDTLTTYKSPKMMSEFEPDHLGYLNKLYNKQAELIAAINSLSKTAEGYQKQLKQISNLIEESNSTINHVPVEERPVLGPDSMMPNSYYDREEELPEKSVSRRVSRSLR